MECYRHACAHVRMLPMTAEKQQGHRQHHNKSTEAAVSSCPTRDIDVGQQNLRSFTVRCTCMPKVTLPRNRHIYICPSWTAAPTSQSRRILEYAASGLKITLCTSRKKTKCCKKQLLINASISAFLYITLFCKICRSSEIENALQWALSWHLWFLMHTC